MPCKEEEAAVFWAAKLFVVELFFDTQIAANQRNRTRNVTFFTEKGLGLDRRHLGKMQANLLLRSACTVFVALGTNTGYSALFAAGTGRIGLVIQHFENLLNLVRRFEKSNGIVTQLRFQLAFR